MEVCSYFDRMASMSICVRTGHIPVIIDIYFISKLMQQCCRAAPSGCICALFTALLSLFVFCIFKLFPPA